MAKHFSKETREKIREKAREREQRKRDAKAAAGGTAPEEPRRATVIEDTISPQTRRKVAELHEVRAKMGASLDDLKGKLKVARESADLAVSERDAIFAASRSNGSISPDRDQAAKITSLSATRAKLLVKIGEIKEKSKAARSAIAAALAETDRLIAGENLAGTIFEGTASKALARREG